MTRCRAQVDYMYNGQRRKRRCKLSAVIGLEFCAIHQQIRPPPKLKDQRSKVHFIQFRISRRQKEILEHECAVLGFDYFTEYVRWKLSLSDIEQEKNTQLLWDGYTELRNRLEVNELKLRRVLSAPELQEKNCLCLNCGQPLGKKTGLADFCGKCYTQRLEKLRNKEKRIWEDVAKLPGSSAWLKKHFGGKPK